MLACTRTREARGVYQRLPWAPTFALVLLKPGPLVSSVAGSIGGVTFQRGPGFLTARSKPLPRRRRTQYTATQRQAVAYLAAEWRKLDADDRQQWTDAALEMEWRNRFGDVIPGKGFWLYNRCNQYLSLVGSALVTKPEKAPTFTPIEGLALEYTTAPLIKLTFTSPAGPDADTGWAIFCTPPLSAGRSASFGDYRFVRVFTTGTSNEIDITNDWQKRYATAAALHTALFVKVVPVDLIGGNVGPTVTASAVAV